MTTINFYCIDESISDFTYNLLYQLVVKNNKKVFLYSNSMEKLEKLNTFLWQTGKSSDFLPHSLITDKNLTDKLLLSNQLNNKYKQEYLLLSTFIEDRDFLSSFDKIFYIFKKNNINEAKKISDFLKDFQIQINVKKDKWLTVNSLEDILP